MAADIRRCKKTFNVISIALIDQLLKLFSDEPTLSFFRSEIEKFAKDKTQDHVPAANFFQTMNIATKIPPSDIQKEAGEKAVVVGELLIRKDERLFGPDTGVVIPALEALGLKDKWPKLSPVNREMVWDYLIRMAKCSAQVVINMQMANPKMREVLEEVKRGECLQPGASEKEYAEFAGRVNTLVQKAMTH